MVSLRPCAVAGGAWALPELDVFVVVEEVEYPATGPDKLSMFKLREVLLRGLRAWVRSSMAVMGKSR